MAAAINSLPVTCTGLIYGTSTTNNMGLIQPAGSNETSVTVNFTVNEGGTGVFANNTASSASLVVSGLTAPLPYFPGQSYTLTIA